MVPAAGVLGGEAEPRYRGWVEQMKSDPRGPFDAVKWFCKDGTVLPPKAYACEPHGGGHQHGEWSERTRELRANGYLIANLLAGVDADTVARDPGFAEQYAQMLVERYLIAADDGWILRRALFYRGAIQEEDERAGGRSLLAALATRPEWLEVRYPLLRAGVRLLPHGEDSASVQKIRQLSAGLADSDPDFQRLRAKIHGSPDADDATRVRDYAAGVADPERRTAYESLADEIDAVYRGAPLAATLRAFAAGRAVDPAFGQQLVETAVGLEADAGEMNTFEKTATLLAEIREHLPTAGDGSARLALLDLSLEVESAHFRAGATLAQRVARLSRRERGALLSASAQAAYGTGLLRAREIQAMRPALGRLAAGGQLPVADYLEALGYLGRAPGWAAQGMRFHFQPAMDTLGEIEPKAELFVQDMLRGSPMLAYSRMLDTLARDADRLAGISHRLFDEDVGVGFRALNPGMARGTLVTRPDMARIGEFRRDGIYVLPETVAELPPVAGILTAGEGNPLSHVQLLARNLGIPNVAVAQAALDRLHARDGESVVMAVSAAGVVEIQPDGPEWDAYFDTEGESGDVVIRPDLEKLDLSVRDFISLDRLRAADSGRIVGPKAAKLGELRNAFPDKVAPGVAIPFGLFRAVVLDRPYKASGRSVFDRMSAEFRRIEQMPDAAQAADYEKLRAEIYGLIRDTDPGPDFRARLRAEMERAFGSVEGVGVFIRSDTNVEDLPGFTGAGLNLTVPNVVGFENIIRNLKDVWASPYTKRAFAWRNSHMEGPEHVYPAVLLLKTVPADKSGVMITADIDNGDRNVLSVAVNEGVGGAVEGQAAESLRIDRRTGAARLLAIATAPTRHVPLAQGGVAELPASGAETLLQPQEIRQLVDISAEIPQKFPPIVDDQGRPAPADIEFAFVDSKLQLLQIRPFLESRKAKGSSYLMAMDEALHASREKTVDLEEVPR
jgi:phosphohistidine swiveling domain-containing protein